MNRQMISQGLTAMIFFSLLTVVAACAQCNGGGRPPGPPPEAIKACEGKTEGDAVSFSGRGGESVKATCKTIEGQLVAVPEGHRPQ